MHKTIVALYDTRSDAETAIRDLEADGFDRSITEIVSHTDTTPDIMATTDMVTEASGGLLSRLTAWDVPESDAQVYAEGVRRGGVLLKLHVDDEDVDRAVTVLEQGSVVDLDERREMYRTTGWTAYEEGAVPYDDAMAAEERARYASLGATPGLGSAAEAFRDTNTRTDTTVGRAVGQDVGAGREEVIPVAEERIDIGKRQVERGSVRVRTYVTETPVNEQVNLRQEHVSVERRSVDRAVDARSEDAFREREVEITETAEEAVVQKRAHVKEEIVIRKDVEERAQTVSDTVRRTEVDVDDGRTDTPRRDDIER